MTARFTTPSCGCPSMIIWFKFHRQFTNFRKVSTNSLWQMLELVDLWRFILYHPLGIGREWEREPGRASSRDRCSRLPWLRPLPPLGSLTNRDSVDHPQCRRTPVDFYPYRLSHTFVGDHILSFHLRLFGSSLARSIAWRQSRRHFRGACQDATTYALLLYISTRIL